MTRRARQELRAGQVPPTIGEYMAALNAALEVGLKSRQRILVEVLDHLSLAA